VWAAAAAAEHLLASGHGTAALARIERVRPQAPAGRPADHLDCVAARALLATGAPERARALAAPLVGAVGTDEVTKVEAGVVTALAEYRLRREGVATTALADALDRAERCDVAGPFRRCRGELRPLLDRHLRLVGTHAGRVSALLRVGPTGAAVAAVAASNVPAVELTEREVTVLAYLPTLLTNAEIADELHVTVHTVKQHLKAVYRKLGVATRRQAVLRAHELGIVRHASDAMLPAGRPSTTP
jgi:LuxR family maltose regulon positive regulatory protein